MLLKLIEINFGVPLFSNPFLSKKTFLNEKMAVPTYVLIY